MFRTATFAAMILVAGTASAALTSNNPRFDGTLSVIGLKGPSCSQLAVAKKDSFQAVLRPRVPGTSSPDSLSIVLPRGAVLLEALGDGRFPGSNQPVKGSFIFDGLGGTTPAKTAISTQYTPATLAANTTEIFLGGAIRHFALPGCTVEIRGFFIKRP